MKSKVDKLDVHVDLSKLSDAVINDVVKKDVYTAKIGNIKDKVPAISKLAINTTLNAKINGVKNKPTTTDLNVKIYKVKNKISKTTNLATTTALTAVQNKIPIVGNLVEKAG